MRKFTEFSKALGAGTWEVQRPRACPQGRCRWTDALALCGALTVAAFLGAAPLRAAEASEKVAKAEALPPAGRTRFVATLAKSVKVRVFSTVRPSRVIVELPRIRLALPKRPKGAAGLIKSFRYVSFGAKRARILIELSAPAQIAKSEVRPIAGSNHARLVVDLVPMGVKVMRGSIKPADTGGARAARASGGKLTIILDPGHGGIDSGAVSRFGTMEKKIVLEFAKLLRRKLLASKRYDVRMTRDTDVFIKLDDRVKFARENRGRLFVSIHADSMPGALARRVRGATVYLLSEKASDEEAHILATNANKSDLLAGISLPKRGRGEVRGILAELARRETEHFSRLFAERLVDKLKGRARLAKKPIRSAAFRVLRSATIPSVLLELGYLSNKNDENLLKSDQWRKRVVDGLAAAIDEFFAASRKPLPVLVEE